MHTSQSSRKYFYPITQHHSIMPSPWHNHTITPPQSQHHIITPSPSYHHQHCRAHPASHHHHAITASPSYHHTITPTPPLIADGDDGLHHSRLDKQKTQMWGRVGDGTCQIWLVKIMPYKSSKCPIITISKHLKSSITTITLTNQHHAQQPLDLGSHILMF